MDLTLLCTYFINFLDIFPLPVSSTYIGPPLSFQVPQLFFSYFRAGWKGASSGQVPFWQSGRYSDLLSVRNLEERHADEGEWANSPGNGVENERRCAKSVKYREEGVKYPYLPRKQE